MAPKHLEIEGRERETGMCSNDLKGDREGRERGRAPNGYESSRKTF